MKTTLALTILTAVVLTMGSSSAAADLVVGEKLDSGLGELSPSYTAAEFNASSEARIPGESLDSGLGELAADYTAGQFNGVRVPGEKLDSGLGALSVEEVMKYVLTHSSRETAALR